jgi:hypothetical protein
VELIAGDIETFVSARKRLVAGLLLRLPAELGHFELLQVRDALADHPGSAVVLFETEVNGQRVLIRPESRFRVNPSDELLQILERLLGGGCVIQLRAAELEMELEPLATA